MKRLVVIAFVFLAMTGFSQQDGAWSMGLQWGFQGNHSDFSGGMDVAHARFQHNTYGAGALDLIVRYDLTKHWMFTSGMGFTSYGFEYAIANNYSFLNGGEDFRNTTIRNSFSAFTLPTLVHFKFNPNCRNVKWILGLGFSHHFTDDNVSSAGYVEGVEGSVTANTMTSEAIGHGGVQTMLCFSVAREKVFKRGSMLNLSMLFNWGFEEMGRSTVNYVIDGEEFSHEFTNSGNFVGFRMAYYFRSFKSCRATR